MTKLKAKKKILRKSSFAISEIESWEGKQITTFIFFHKDSYQFPRGNNSDV